MSTHSSVNKPPRFDAQSVTFRALGGSLLGSGLTESRKCRSSKGPLANAQLHRRRTTPSLDSRLNILRSERPLLLPSSHHQDQDQDHHHHHHQLHPPKETRNVIHHHNNSNLPPPHHPNRPHPQNHPDTPSLPPRNQQPLQHRQAQTRLRRPVVHDLTSESTRGLPPLQHNNPHPMSNRDLVLRADKQNHTHRTQLRARVHEPLVLTYR